jgi:hypothetical protein
MKEEETELYGWSGLDLSDQTQTLDMRLGRMGYLIDTFTTEHVHIVQKYKNAAETQTEAKKWCGRKVSLNFPAMIKCTSEDFIEELRVCWPVLARKWQMEVEGKITISQN